jgi:alpha-tubulin suppressor-like RCC1 family protein
MVTALVVVGSIVAATGAATPVAAADGGFADVPPGAYYASAADWLQREGITTGYGGDATRFAPDITVTRAQMAAFLWRLRGQPDAPAGGFVDIPTGAYYEAAAAWLKDQGITTGYGGDPTRFAPDITVTRAQMAAFLWRLADSPAAPASCGFADVPVGAFYGAAACWLKAEGITTSFPAFDPLGLVSRAQMAAFLYRFDLATSGSAGVVSVDAGYDHTCAVTTAGTVKCWGSNDLAGQLGDGTTTNRWNPVTVVGIGNATAVTAGATHSCALLAGGTVRCWGSNDRGQLGNGTTTTSGVPVTVAGISTATALTSGPLHTCALLADGGVSCWGDNFSGQLGDGNTATSSTIPVRVTQLTGATGVAAGLSHTCAVRSGGTVSCWGRNGSGQLGDGTTTDSPTPVTVAGVAGAVRITATGADPVLPGSSTSCAVLTTGDVRCWGGNAFGQVGDGTTANAPTPAAVAGVAGAASVTTDFGRTCAVVAGGAVSCWGLNDAGQLGDGTATSSPTPRSAAVTGAVTVTGGRSHSCALLADGRVRCWGGNGSGQLGDGSNAPSTTPVDVVGLS